MLKTVALAISLSSPFTTAGIQGDFRTESIKPQENWAQYLEVCFAMNHPSSVSACTHLINKSPLSQDHINLVYGYRGYAHMFKDQFEAGLEDFNEALAEDKNKPEFLNGRAMAYERLGKTKKALENYTLAVKFKKDYAQAYDNRGQLLRRLGHLDKAISDFKQLISILPGNVDAYYQLGFTYHQKGDFKKAIKSYTIGIRLNTQHPGLYAKRGLSYRRDGNVELAIQDYSKAIDLDPREPVYYNNRAWAFMVQGKLKNGLQDANKALELESKSERAAAFYDTRAHIHEALGDKDLAIEDFKNAVKASPSEKYLKKLQKRGVTPELK